MAEDVRQKEDEEPKRLTCESPFVSVTYGLNQYTMVHPSEYQGLLAKWEGGHQFWRGRNVYGALVSLRLDSVVCIEMVDLPTIEKKKWDEKEENRRYKEEDRSF